MTTDGSGQDLDVSRRTVIQAAGIAGVGLVAGASHGTETAPTDESPQPLAYVGAAQDLSAIDPYTGEIAWTFTEPEGSVWSSPTVVDGVAYVGDNEGNLWAVDAATGDELWQFDEAGDWVQSSPVVVDGTVYIGEGGGTDTEDWDYAVYAIDAGSGEEEWRFDDLQGRATGSLAVTDGTVYAGTDSVSLYGINAATGGKQWEQTTSNHVRDSPTAHDGTVYVREGELHARDASTGQETWEYEIPWDGTMGNSSPTVFNGTVYVASRKGELHAVDAASGTEQWVFDDGGEGRYSAPTVAGDHVFVCLDGTLYAIDIHSGDVDWDYDNPDFDLRTTPTVFHGTVYVAGTAVHAVDAQSGEEQWVTDPIGAVESSVTVALDPDAGDSVGSRVMLGTLGHHDAWATGSPILDALEAPETENGADDDGDQETDDGTDAEETDEDGTTDAGTDDGEATEDEEDDTDAADDPGDDADDDGPGFGFTSVAAGIGGAGYVLFRRATGEADTNAE